MPGDIIQLRDWIPTYDDLMAAARLHPQSSVVWSLIKKYGGGPVCHLNTIPPQNRRAFIRECEEAQIHAAQIGRREWPESAVTNINELL